ncbi:MAG: LysR substrate-binding domain-containing protein [Burkholderiales bacterium]
MERLPLTSVRTFAVVARLLSISRAAEELNVTPSAVSHQIKVLEDYLGVSLFKRDKNKLKLTPAGQVYMSQVSQGLLLLAEATRTIKAAKGEQTLRIAAPPSLANLWLVESIGRFLKEEPDISITLTALPDPAPLLQGAFDIGFWYGGAGIPNLTSESLGPNCVFPICKPDLIAGERGLKSPRDLVRHTLLESSDEAYYGYRQPRQPGWERWLQVAGVSEFANGRTLNFTPRIVMHKAVTAGLGIGLTQSLLAVEGLSAKQIAVPFGPVMAVAATYHLVYSHHVSKRSDVVAFREWIRADAAASREKIQKLLARFIDK